MDWFKRMCLRTAEEPEIQKKLEEVIKREPDYFAVRNGLSEIQRQQLEAYLTACEELDHAMMLMAYEEGRMWRET